MSEKTYTLTIEYDDNRGNKDDVISASGHPSDGLTYTQEGLRKFIARIEEMAMEGDPVDFYARVKSVVAQ